MAVTLIVVATFLVPPVPAAAGGPDRQAAADAEAPPLVAVSAGWNYTCALVADGSARCWGGNVFGRLGTGTTLNTIIPKPVVSIDSAVTISAGGAHGCALLDGGAVRCWGASFGGQLGNGSKATYSSTPVTVTGIDSAIAISAGGFHGCALLADGTVRCWGYNTAGEVGNGTTQTVRTPVQVLGIDNAVTIATGSQSTCAVLEDGTVKCWGNAPPGSATPAVPHVVAGIDHAVSVALGGEHACALLTDGTIQCWGNNDAGQLGDGSTNSSVTPVAVVGIDTATAISADGHTCALLEDHSVKCWGSNYVGQLGDGSTTTRLTPVSVVGIDDATAIDAGGEHTCAVLADATVNCWGRNDSGELGDRTVIGRLTPVPLSFVPDTIQPIVPTPTVSFVLRLPVSEKKLPGRLAFPTDDDPGGTGIDHFVLERRRGHGDHWILRGHPLAPFARVHVPTSGTVRYRVRAVDRAANSGPWATTPELRGRLIQQSASSIRYAGAWRTEVSSAHLGGSVRSSDDAGASATSTVTGRAVALVSAVGPNRGKVQVYVDGVHWSTVDLDAGKARHRLVVWQLSWPSVETHKIRFVVAGHDRVDLDALATLR